MFINKKYTSDKKIYTILSSNFSTKYKGDYLEKLVTSGIGLLHLDLDGTTQEVYQKYRKRGDLDLVIENISEAVKIKKKLNLKYPIIETTMLVMSHNEHQTDDFIELSKKLGVDNHTLGKIQVNPNTSKKWLPKNKEFVYKTYEDNTRDQHCMWPWSGMVINWNGGISPCCLIDDHEVDFGNFFEKNLYDIWNNEFFLSSRSTFSSEKLNNKKLTICNICKNETHNKDLKRASDSFALIKQN